MVTDPSGVSTLPTNTSSTNTAATAASSATGALTGGTNMGKEDFLKLLTTQLQNQDPLSPADPKDFVAQLSQFSSLEQLINLNTTMGNFSTTFQGLQNSQQMTQGVSLLDKMVKAQGNSFAVTDGEAVNASFILGSAAKSTKVNIFNSGNTLVRTIDLGAQSRGECQVAWDGKDSNGNKVPDGTYSFQVAATDAQGKSLDTATYITGKVEEVLQDANKVYLKVNGRLITLDSILSIDES